MELKPAIIILLLQISCGFFSAHAEDCLNSVNSEDFPFCQVVDNSKAGSSFICIPIMENAIYIKKEGDITLDCTAPYPIDMNYNGVLPVSNLNVEFYKKVQDGGAGQRSGLDALPLQYGVKARIQHATLVWSGQYLFHKLTTPNDTVTISVFTEKSTLPFFLPINHQADALAYVDTARQQLVIPCRLQNYNSSVILYQDYGEVEAGDKLTYDPRIGFFRSLDDEEDLHGEYECLTTWGDLNDRVKVQYPDEADEEAGEVEENEEPEPATLKGAITYETSPANELSSKCKIPEGQADPESFVFANIKAENPTISRLDIRCLDLESEHACDDEKKIGKMISGTSTLEIKPIYSSGLLRCSDATHKEVEEYFAGEDNKIYYNWEEAAKNKALVKVEPAEAYTEYTPVGEFGFNCKFPSYVGVMPVWWGIKYENGTLIEEFDHTGLTKSLSLVEQVVEIQCGITLWNSTTWQKAFIPITVIVPALPIMKADQPTAASFRNNDLNQALLCVIEPEPVASWEWRRDGKKVEDLPSVLLDNSLILFFPRTDKSREGVYTCVGTTKSGKTAELEFKVTIEDEPKPPEEPKPIVEAPKPVDKCGGEPNPTLHHMNNETEIESLSSVSPDEILILRMHPANCSKDPSSPEPKIFVRVTDEADLNKTTSPIVPEAQLPADRCSGGPSPTIHHMNNDTEIGSLSSVKENEILILRIHPANCTKNSSIPEPKIYVRVTDEAAAEGRDNGTNQILPQSEPPSDACSGEPSPRLHRMNDDTEIDSLSSVKQNEILILRMFPPNCTMNFSDPANQILVRVTNSEALNTHEPLLVGEPDLSPYGKQPLPKFSMLARLLFPMLIGFGSILLVLVVAYGTYSYYVMPWKLRRLNTVSHIPFDQQNHKF